MRKKNQYCEIDTFIKKVIILYNEQIFFIKINNRSIKVVKKFEKKQKYGWQIALI